jgi:hypothetical protein
MHRRQTACAGAAQQAQQKGLGLIVTRVAERDDRRVGLDSRALEEFVPGVARGILNRSTFTTRQIRNVSSIGHQRPAERQGEFGAEPLIAIGIGAQLMVEMGERRNAQIAGAIERHHEMRERD